MQGGKSWQRTLAHLVSTALKSSTSCVISQECSMALCLLAPFGEEQKDAQQPLHLGKPGKATPPQNPPCERLCGGQACGLVREKPSGAKPPSFPDGKAPGFSACAGLWAAFPPQVGERPVHARSGAIWGPQGPVWQKEKKPPSLPVRGEFGGVKKKQDKGSGSLERPQPDYLARQSRSFRAFCPLPPTKKSGVGWEALGSRSGSETRNFPVASHFSGCHRRGQRKDEEKIWQKKI